MARPVLTWLDQDNADFPREEYEGACNDDDPTRFCSNGCGTPVGWVTKWSNNGYQDYPYAVLADCAKLSGGDDVLCGECAQDATDNHFVVEAI